MGIDIGHSIASRQYIILIIAAKFLNMIRLSRASSAVKVPVNLKDESSDAASISSGRTICY